MGPWRPLAPKSAPYITPEGYKKLEKETAGLWKKRNEVTKALTAAAEEGDRSENAEYIYRKKQLREIDGRLTYLQQRMPKLTIVKEVLNQQQIFFGAWVTVKDEDGNKKKYRIVGADELNDHKLYITLDSPLAKLLLGKTIDDEIMLDITGKEQALSVVRIEYEA